MWCRVVWYIYIYICTYWLFRGMHFRLHQDMNSVMNPKDRGVEFLGQSVPNRSHGVTFHKTVISSTVWSLTFWFHPMLDVWILIWKYHIPREISNALKMGGPVETAAWLPWESEDSICKTPGSEPPFELKREVQRLTKALRRRDPNRKQGPSSAKPTGFLSLSRSRSKLEFA